jgi:hypothetical protein
VGTAKSVLLREASVLRRHQLGLFFVLTFAISWSIWIPMALASLGIRTTAGAFLNGHVPLYFVAGTGQYETLSAGADPAFTIGGFVVWTIGLSVLFTWLFNQSCCSLLVVVLFHTSADIGSMLPSVVGSAGAALYLYVLLTWIVAIVVVVRFGRATLASVSPDRRG